MRRFPIRKKIRLPLSVYQRSHVFFITISTFRKIPWFQGHPELCNTAMELMREVCPTISSKIYAWCIMPDHIHFMLPSDDVIEFVRRFKGKMVSRARMIDPGRRLWQRSFFDHALRKEEALEDVCVYIWENPVRSGIVKMPAEYLWSGSEVWANWREFFG